ncbi:MAG TPA: SufD family Fe-S cluster assembly protein [Alphaproteobacteria bacterium]|nr:SufD family Fe-S cluster assembly protein [Alphaproteobacteria bacterium]
MNALNISEELNNRLKRKGLYDDRLNSLEKFQEENKKNFKHSLGVRTDLEFIDYDSATSEGKTTIKINGELFNAHQEIKGITIYKLNEFLHDGNIDPVYKEMMVKYLSNKFSEAVSGSKEKQYSKLEHLHLALSNAMIFVLPDNYNSNKFFEIKRTVEGNSYNHIIVLTGDNCNSKIYLKTSHESNSNNIHSIITDYTDIILGKNSMMEFVEHRSLSNKDVVFGRKNSTLESGAKLEWTNIDKDSRLSLIEQHSNAFGDNSKSTMNNIICGKNSEYCIYNISEHTGANTESLMQNRSVLKKNKAIIKGLVKINKNAHSSNGYQKSDMLILDDESRGISIPDLEIHNHNVKCTHGSTITKLDKEKIFYLESRGLEKKDAEQLIIEGFYDKALNGISDESLRESIKTEILED